MNERFTAVNSDSSAERFNPLHSSGETKQKLFVLVRTLVTLKDIAASA